jgi:hypothetical protein
MLLIELGTSVVQRSSWGLNTEFQIELRQVPQRGEEKDPVHAAQYIYRINGDISASKLV